MQPARTRLHVDIRRQQLLELGLQLFASHTYDGLSIDEIARQAGISKGLLYHYFPSKRAFYVAAVTAAAEQLIEETDTEYRFGNEPDLEGIREAIRAFLLYVSRRRAEYVFLVRGGVGSDPEVTEILEGTRQALVDRIVVRLARFGVADGPGARLRLRGWIGFLEGSTLDWIQTQEIETEDFLELLVDMAGKVLGAVIKSSAPR